MPQPICPAPIIPTVLIIEANTHVQQVAAMTLPQMQKYRTGRAGPV
jgi:hypothetical protein